MTDVAQSVDTLLEPGIVVPHERLPNRSEPSRCRAEAKPLVLGAGDGPSELANGGEVGEVQVFVQRLGALVTSPIIAVLRLMEAHSNFCS